ncbi:MAG: hypothetical protein RIT07_1675 [Bacteroidota bacterium]
MNHKDTKINADFQEVWDAAAGYTYPEASQNTEQWNAFQSKLSSHNLKITHRPLYTRKWFVAAATMALLAGFTAIIYSNLAGGHVQPLVATTGPGEVKTITLPDGSEVTLNSKPSPCLMVRK